MGNLASNGKHGFGSFTPSPILAIVLSDIPIKSYVKCSKNITTAFSHTLCRGNHGTESKYFALQLQYVHNMESLFDYCSVIQPRQRNINMIT